MPAGDAHKGALPITGSRVAFNTTSTHTTALPSPCLRMAVRLGGGAPFPGQAHVPCGWPCAPLPCAPLGCWGASPPPGVGWRCQSSPFGVGMSPGCTAAGMPQGPPICVEPAIRARGARFSGPLPLVALWPRTSIVRNPAIPARALLPREMDIRDLGALATEVQKQHKGAIETPGGQAISFLHTIAKF